MKSKATVAPEIVTEQPNGNGQAHNDPLTPEQRSQACAVDIQRILAMYQCDLSAYPVFTAEGRVIAQIQIVPRAKQP